MLRWQYFCEQLTAKSSFVHVTDAYFETIEIKQLDKTKQLHKSLLKSNFQSTVIFKPLPRLIKRSIHLMENII